MRVESTPDTGSLFLRNHKARSPSLPGLLDRGSWPSKLPIQEIELCYPSPPMSRSPSPPRLSQPAPVTSSGSLASVLTNSEAIFPNQTQGTREPGRASQTPPSLTPARRSSLASILQQPPRSDLPVHSSTVSSSPNPSSSSLGLFDRHGSSSQQPDVRGPHPDASYIRSGPAYTALAASSQFGSVANLLDTSAQLQSADTLSSSSTRGRKVMGHVVSACVHCKKAHLSCDINRPCARCVASGKQVGYPPSCSSISLANPQQDTCVDVQQKKRGRPRLREESRFQGEQISTELAPRPSTTSATFASTPRRIAQPRRRRNDSIRSLPSQGSDESFVSAYATGYALPAQPLLSGASLPAQPSQDPPISPFDTPTAFLDLDLIIIRSNQAFRHTLDTGEDLKGRDLADFVAPAEQDGYATLRLQLRQEREAREPRLMPPMVAPGHDPVQGVTEENIDALAYGFMDRRVSLTKTSSAPGNEILMARMRLAKAQDYFVALTIPILRHGQHRPPLPVPHSMPAATFTTFDPFDPRRAAAQPVFPPPGPSPTQIVPPELHRSAPSSYPPSSPSLGWRPLPPAPPPPLPPPHYTTRLDHPPGLERPPAIPRPVDPFPHLPFPVALSQLPRSHTASLASNPTTSTVQASFVSEEDDDDDGGDGRPSSKRRKMDINEVLQK